MRQEVARRVWVAALVLAVLATAATVEDEMEDLLLDQSTAPKLSEVAGEAKTSGHGVENAEPQGDLGEGMDLGEGAAVAEYASKKPGVQAAADSVSSGANKYLCYKTEDRKVEALTRTTDIQFSRCDANARCDSSKATCHCNVGYTGDGSTCALVDCKAPPKVDHGVVACSKNTWKSVASYSCNKGYVRSGSSTRTCQADGRWSGTNAVCKPRECGKLAAPSNSVMKCTGTHYQKTCFATCKTGYRLVKPTAKSALPFIKNEGVLRTCGSDGKWSGFEAKCRIVSCPASKKVIYGSDKCRNRIWKSTCSFKCIAGHHLTNKPGVTESKRTCQASGAWDNSVPLTCAVDQCPKLGAPANGKMTCSKTSYRGVCKFRCNAGYRKHGNEENLRCTAGGKWDGKSPICKIRDCGNLDHPDNGKVNHAGGTTWKQRATYTCDVGHYRTAGTRQRRCLSNGRWSGSKSVCTVRNCGNIASPTDGSLKCTGTTYGKTCTYSCNVGHDLIGSNIRKCMENGKWSGSDAQCRVKDCGGLDTPVNAMKACKSTTYGKECAFACKEGFFLVGDERRKCGAVGKWSGSQPRCTPHTCGVPPEPEHGKKNLQWCRISEEMQIQLQHRVFEVR